MKPSLWFATRSRGLMLVALVAPLIVASGCTKSRSSLDPSGSPANPFDDLVVALMVRSFEVVQVDQTRAVLFKMSRVPDGVHASELADPARLELVIDGPLAGEDVAAESYPGGDPVIEEIQMSRVGGQVHVVLSFSGGDVPKYEVQQMADWVMVRFPPKK